MKKIIFAMAVLFGCATKSFAQTSFIATLQHEGEFTHYYGAGALTTAYNAAEAGDIITLSPGTFTSPGTIDKSITLRGAGIETNDTTSAAAMPNLTFVSGDLTFRSTESKYVTTVEGIRFYNTVCVENNASGNGQGSIKFIKNYIGVMKATVGSVFSEERGPKTRIYNCILYDFIFNVNAYPDFLLYNCFVKDPRWDGSAIETTSTFTNCVVKWQKVYYNGYNRPYKERAHYMNFYNCIFYESLDASSYLWNNVLPNTATCINCLSINDSSLFSSIVSGANNKTISNIADVFRTYSGDPSWKESFELTDAAKEAYIGTDGTQIGMQGGNYPYTTTVQYPVVTKFNSDPQTNKAGMLNVEVEVDGK